MSQKQLLEVIMCHFFKHQIQLKLFHFQTKTFAAHKASDDYLSKFEGNVDKFMEVAQGVFGRLNMKHVELNFAVVNDGTIKNEVCELVSVLRKFDGLDGLSKRAELLNIRDEMVADAEQFKYLLTFQ